MRQLAEDLGTSPNTMLEALRILEREGLLVSQGPGRRSRIVPPKGRKSKGMEVEILRYEKADAGAEFLMELNYRLLEGGHRPRFSGKTLGELGMDVNRVARHVRHTKADAWVVVAGSKLVLEWFASQPVPTLSIFGCLRDVPSLAGVVPEKKPALGLAVRLLVGLGHRRIVMMVREERRIPEPGFIERHFLELLQAEGIATGPYHLPDWEENPAGLCHCLDSLFAHTPPTALIFDEPQFMTAARLHLAQRGINSPKDVSVLCMDHDPGFGWCQPAITHFVWQPGALVRRVVRWVNSLERGKDDREQTFLETEFIEGGTIGPVPVQA